MNPTGHFLICVANEGCEDLQILKVYRQLPDEGAAAKGFVRVVDDSGEDYLYPESLFLPLVLSPSLEARLEDVALALASA